MGNVLCRTLAFLLSIAKSQAIQFSATRPSHECSKRADEDEPSSDSDEDEQLTAEEEGSVGENEDNELQNCALCQWGFPQSEYYIHIQQHFLRILCPCGYQNPSRQVVHAHQLAEGKTESHGGPDSLVFEVDAQSYPAFCQERGWTKGNQSECDGQPPTSPQLAHFQLQPNQYQDCSTEGQKVIQQFELQLSRLQEQANTTRQRLVETERTSMEVDWLRAKLEDITEKIHLFCMWKEHMTQEVENMSN